MTSLPLSTGNANADLIPACSAAECRVKFASLATSLTQTGRALATTLARRSAPTENSPDSETERKAWKRSSGVELQIGEEAKCFFPGEAKQACPSGQPVKSQTRSTANCIASAMVVTWLAVVATSFSNSSCLFFWYKVSSLSLSLVISKPTP